MRERKGENDGYSGTPSGHTRQHWPTPERVITEDLRSYRTGGPAAVWISLVPREQHGTRRRSCNPGSRQAAALGHPVRGQGQHRRRRHADHRRLPGIRLHRRASPRPWSQRLEAAGAILIGKTNLDQFATGLVGTRSPVRRLRQRLRCAVHLRRIELRLGRRGRQWHR